MRRSIAAIGLLVIFAFAGELSAKDFFLKKDDKTLIRTKLSMDSEAKGDLIISDPKSFSRFLINDQMLPPERVSVREPSDVEKMIDASFMILTGFLMIAAHDTYDLNSELRLSSVKGILLFLFPFEDENLYIHCNSDQYLVASSTRPNEESLKRMKTIEEVRNLCHKPEPAPEDPS